MCYSKAFKLLIKTWTSLHIIDKSAGGGGQFGLEQCICNGARLGRPWPSATKFLTLREPGAVYLSNKRSLIKSTWSSRIHKTRGRWLASGRFGVCILRTTQTSCRQLDQISAQASKKSKQRKEIKNGDGRWKEQKVTRQEKEPRLLPSTVSGGDSQVQTKKS